LTVVDAFNHYLQHMHARLEPHGLALAAYCLWSFAEQFGDEPVERMRGWHIGVFVRQPKEGQAGVGYWSPDARRRAACILREALTWATQKAG
jgi:hypothetical protein